MYVYHLPSMHYNNRLVGTTTCNGHWSTGHRFSKMHSVLDVTKGKVIFWQTNTIIFYDSVMWYSFEVLGTFMVVSGLLIANEFMMKSDLIFWTLFPVFHSVTLCMKLYRILKNLINVVKNCESTVEVPEYTHSDKKKKKKNFWINQQNPCSRFCTGRYLLNEQGRQNMCMCAQLVELTTTAPAMICVSRRRFIIATVHYTLGHDLLSISKGPPVLTWHSKSLCYDPLMLGWVSMLQHKFPVLYTVFLKWWDSSSLQVQWW